VKAAIGKHRSVDASINVPESGRSIRNYGSASDILSATPRCPRREGAAIRGHRLGALVRFPASGRLANAITARAAAIRTGRSSCREQDRLEASARAQARHVTKVSHTKRDIFLL
jgi:hypothetical protein